MTQNIILDNGGSNQLTINSTQVEESRINELNSFTPPTTSVNYTNGAEKTIIINLLKIQLRFLIDGEIAYSDRTKLRNIFENGGTVVMTYAGENFNVVLEKLIMTERASDVDTPEYITVKFTVLDGKSFGSS